MDDVAKPIGKIIKRLRQEAELSQEQLAHRAGIHRTYVSQIERGDAEPSIFILRKLGKALDKRAWELVRMWEQPGGNKPK